MPNFLNVNSSTLELILQYLYTPYSKASGELALVCKQFHESYRRLPGECVRLIMREYSLTTDKPEELIDHSEETLEEYRNRVFLMYLTTTLADLKLQDFRVAGDVHPLYPNYVPNQDIVVDFRPPTEDDTKKMKELARKMTIKFQSTPYECEWLAFDAFSDKMQYSVHHKWCEVAIHLAEGNVTLHYQDSFEHEDPNFGPFGLAQRLLQATPENKEVAAAVGLEEGTSVVSQAFKECHSYDNFRYYVNEDFFLKIGGALGWEKCTVPQVLTLVSLMLTQTHRRVFSALLANSYGVMHMSEPVPDTIERLAENLMMVYPSKKPESLRAEELAAKAKISLTKSHLELEDKIGVVEFMRNKLQSIYDGQLLAAAGPSAAPNPHVHAGMGLASMGQMVTFNAALNQQYLNSFYGPAYGYPMAPYPYPPVPATYPQYYSPDYAAYPGAGASYAQDATGQHSSKKKGGQGNAHQPAEGGTGGRGGYGGRGAKRGQGQWGRGKGGKGSKGGDEVQQNAAKSSRENRGSHKSVGREDWGKPSRGSKKDRPQKHKQDREDKKENKQPAQEVPKKDEVNFPAPGAEPTPVEADREPRVRTPNSNSSNKGGKKKWRPLTDVL
uniref:Uncharacterized protein n=1 Tax=Eutreptiella gymnastica TaxID=73025 RepID=A0A7S1I2A2_9EUGL|mmetsp:Transcript_123853/g.214701  ORF Transcript_123853/g.214701 Transcript_123853/m.214701 type:complete len:611 (+) Transcript_123853:172-2004(+)